MEAYYFLPIIAVNTITLVLKDTAAHAASHTIRGTSLAPSQQQLCKGPFRQLELPFSFMQHFASALNHAEVSPDQFLWLCDSLTVVFIPAKYMWAIHLCDATKTMDLTPEFGCLK